jgi:hypothetical protein
LLHLCQCGVLRVVEGTDSLAPGAAAILEARSQNRLEELGRNFIVLRVGSFWPSRDWTLSQRFDVTL